MNSSAYISLARSYSFVILLAIYFSVNGVVDELDRMMDLSRARHALADFVAHEVVPPGTNAPGISVRTDARRQVVLLQTNLPFVGWVALKFPSDRPDDLWLEFFADEQALRQSGMGQDFKPAWKAHCHGHYSNSLDVLEHVYRNIWNKPPDSNERKDHALLYSKIEYGIGMNRKTTIPGLGIEFDRKWAGWMMSLVIIGFMVQIRNQTRRVRLDENCGFDEPWLLLDGRTGLEWWAAMGWLAALGFAPWIANGCLVAVFSQSMLTLGDVTSLRERLLVSFSFMALFLVGGRASFTVMMELLRLRRLRREKWESVKAARPV